MSVGLERTNPDSQRAAALRALEPKRTQDLLRVLGSGNPPEVLAAAEILTGRYLPAIAKVCHGCVPREDVEDAIASAAFRLFSALKRGQPVGSPGGLAQKIARGECSRILRQRRTAPLPTSDHRDERDIIDLIHTRDRLRAISTSATPTDRVVLRDSILDRPSAETATELETTPGAVNIRRSRLRRSLRKEFEE